jgi:hypothetical protein
MDDVGKRDLPFSCGSNAEDLNASIALFLLKGDGGLNGLLSPEMVCLFELGLSVVNPKIDGTLRLSLNDALVKTRRLQRGSKVAGHPSKAIDRQVRER